MRTCAGVRDRMLEAELAELRGVGGSALASHVRECAACRAVARALLDDTTALARLVAVSPTREASMPAVVAAGPHRRSNRALRRAAFAAVLPLAAAIIFMLIRQPEQGELELGAPSGVEPGASHAPGAVAASASAATRDEARSAPPSSVGSIVQPTPRVARPESETSDIRSAASVAAVAATEPSPVDRRTIDPRSAPRAYDVPSLPGGDNVVRLTPTSGSRTLVMRTRDPAVTVVWIY